MRQYAPKRDANESRLVAHARKRASVSHVSAKGFPDLCIGYRGVNILAEVKDPDKPPSERRLTTSQTEWHMGWQGQVAIVMTEEDVDALLDSVDAALSQPCVAP